MDFTSIIVYLKGFLPTVMMFLMMLSPAFGTIEATSAYTAEAPEELIMSFSAVSDIHVESNNPKPYSMYANVLKGLKAGADNDAVVFLGDNTMNGQTIENMLFYPVLKAINPAENIFVVMGNHDIGNGNGDYNKFAKEYILSNRLYFGSNIGSKPYYYEVVNGCYMIFLASEDLTVNDCVMTEEQLVWLRGVLDEAEAAGSPIFVFNHHPLYQLRGVESNSLAEILNDYDNLLYLYGHTHKEIDAYSFRTEGGVDTVNVPRSTAEGNGIVVEVYEDEVVVRGRNFVTNEWIEDLRFTY